MMLSYKTFESVGTPKDGDAVICVGNIDDIKTHNHVGILRKTNIGWAIQFLNRFDDKLNDLLGWIPVRNGWYIKNPTWTRPFKDENNGINIPLKYSDKFRNVISYSLKFLMDYENIFYTDISYIDITSRNDTISCLSARDFKKLEPNEDPWTSTMRQKIRVGRFLRKIADDTDMIVEDYINEYKFAHNLSKTETAKFKVAKDIDLAKWYLEMNYAPGGGSLHNSCMKHLKSQRRLPLYTENPEKVRLLYLTDKEGKLLGRALIWRLTEPAGVTFMDRVYCVEDYVEKLFLDYAKNRKFLTRADVEKKDTTLIVKMGRDYGSPHDNPFMDTFKYFIRTGNYLTNKFKNFEVGQYWEYNDHD